MKRLVLAIGLLALVLLLCSEPATAARRKKKGSNMLQQRETNPVNFVRLIVMRLVYGVAKMMGLSGPLSEVLDGVFVPPGADDDDYGDDDGDYDEFF